MKDEFNFIYFASVLGKASKIKLTLYGVIFEGFRKGPIAGKMQIPHCAMMFLSFRSIKSARDEGTSRKIPFKERMAKY